MRYLDALATLFGLMLIVAFMSGCAGPRCAEKIERTTWASDRVRAVAVMACAADERNGR